MESDLGQVHLDTAALRVTAGKHVVCNTHMNFGDYADFVKGTLAPARYTHIGLCPQCHKGFREAWEIEHGHLPNFRCLTMLRPSHNY
jgi:hypothetical protein